MMKEPKYWIVFFTSSIAVYDFGMGNYLSSIFCSLACILTVVFYPEK